MSETTSSTKESVHLVQLGEPAASTCLAARCGVQLGRDSPRLTEVVALATCLKCLVSWGAELERRAAQDEADGFLASTTARAVELDHAEALELDRSGL